MLYCHALLPNLTLAPWRQALLIRWRGVSRYFTGLYAFSCVALFASLGALFASFFYNQAR